MIDLNKIDKKELFNHYCNTLEREVDLKHRIDKAIEYIEKHKEPLHHWFDEPDCDYWLATNPDDILDILKGSDSNGND